MTTPELTLFIATSLDGFIASPDGTVDWLFHDADYGFSDFMTSLDAVVMGRKTWEQAKSFEEVPFAGKKIYVFTRSRMESSDARIQFVQGEVSTVLAEIRERTSNRIWLVGGGELIQQFLKSNLIDEFRLFVHPVILGSGIPLFLPQTEMKTLKFEGTQSFPSGLVELRYRRSQFETGPQE